MLVCGGLWIDENFGIAVLFFVIVAFAGRKLYRNYEAVLAAEARERAAFYDLPIEEQEARWREFDAEMLEAWEYEQQQRYYDITGQFWRSDTLSPGVPTVWRH
jgi:hypothetical protein